MFDFNFTGFLGQAFGSFNGGGRGGNRGDIAFVSALIASLNAPIYMAVPVLDKKIVDDFLDKLDPILATLARRKNHDPWFPVEVDFAHLDGTSPDIKGIDVSAPRGYSFKVGPLKWRFFWQRIGNTLYVTSQEWILRDVFAAVVAERNRIAKPELKPKAEAPATAHVSLRIRPENWNQVLPDYRLGWAENNRQACLNNLSSLTSVFRALSAQAKSHPDADKTDLAVAAHKEADRIYGTHFFCPEGGLYMRDSSGIAIACGTHGTVLSPRQPLAPNEATSAIKGISGITMSLTFLEDGLHAVLEVDRK
jgi:hypothetical protein